MKIITTSDWHIGNLFHGNDRLPEHKHFLKWLLSQIEEQRPDALLVAGDIFDNGNPSAAAQSAYYEFLSDATQLSPDMRIVIIAGNHDSASRLEAPRALLTRHNVEVRGNIRRTWEQDEDKGGWVFDYDDLIIPITSRDGDKAVVLAVPYLRSDVVQNADYSEGVKSRITELTDRARERYPDTKLIMMAHMYANGADIAKKDASERIVIGGQEEVKMEGWTNHPDYMVCGHIHKRQHIWGTDWARYTGSALPMSFAEVDYKHGIDVVSFSSFGKVNVNFVEYIPQHKLCVLPKEGEGLSASELKKCIMSELKDRVDGRLDDNFVYLVLKLNFDNKVNNNSIRDLEALVETKNAVLCKIQKIIPAIDVTTITGNQIISSVDGILDRDPLDTLKEAFMVKKHRKMSERQENMLKELLKTLKQEN